ncbi:MAG: histidinol-phosphatase [Bacteroidaceae bacterium]|nr:histidinol-phosphatase [Bacteroidaceae bacterium]
MKTNYHTHTERCHHAVGSDEEYVLSAIKGNYKELGFSDHTPWKYGSNYVSDIRMLPDELSGYVESINKLKEKYKDQISIKIGLECEYFPSYMYWLKTQIKKYNLDYIIYGNHFFHSDEKFRYFAKYTTTVDMLDLYEESTIEGLETGLYAYLAHPDLFILSYPEFDRHCRLMSRHICRTAARLNIPLEYNLSYNWNKKSKSDIIFPCPDFWQIAVNEGCKAIIGLDAHDNKILEDTTLYDNALAQLNELKIEVVDTIPFLTAK